MHNVTGGKAILVNDSFAWLLMRFLGTVLISLVDVMKLK